MILKGRAGSAEAGLRLDEAVARLFAVSKGEARRAVDRGGCRIGGNVVRVASRPVREGDEIFIGLAPEGDFRKFSFSPGDVIHEDGEFLAVNKPAGIYCQRTPYQLVGTAEHAASLLFRDRNISGPVRLVHRLDRGTSGVLFLPKTAASAACASKALHDGKAEKIYLALVSGRPVGDEGTVDAPIAPLGKSRFAVRDDGRPARTDWRLLASGDGVSLVEARPRTGRTHQIRLHMLELGCPVVGDDRYGLHGGPGEVVPPADPAPAGENPPRMMLHCLAMSFRGADGRLVSALAPVDSTFREACRRAGIPEPFLDGYPSPERTAE